MEKLNPPWGQYDVRTPNLKGRVQSEHSDPTNALLRCRRPLIMGTFNANTVREVARLSFVT